MKAIILAAGYATRLYPLTLNTPKPLLPVGNKLMIDYIIAKLELLNDIDTICVVTNNKFFAQFEKWKSSTVCTKPIILVNDGTHSNNDRLGAVADMHHAVKQCSINDDCFVIAGDNLFDFDLREIIKTFKMRKASTIVLYDCKDIELASKCGIAEVDDDDRVVGFVEKPPQPKTTLISTCMYVLSASDIAFLSKIVDSGQKLDNTGDFIRVLSANSRVFTHKYDGKWIDIGTPQQYSRALEEYK